uniref:Uncharacterized protein n=1 Tax=Chenopodium quinoa TaxID=63459 RepID=A0A803M662_CHEQI
FSFRVLERGESKVVGDMADNDDPLSDFVEEDVASFVALAGMPQCTVVQITKKNRCTLVLKKGHPALVERAGKVNDRGWKSRYLFVDKESLGEEASWMRCGWHDGEIDVAVVTHGRKSLRKVEVVLSITKEDRTSCALS